MKLQEPKLLAKLTPSNIDFEIASSIENDIPIENFHFFKDYLRYKDASKSEFRGCLFQNSDLNLYLLVLDNECDKNKSEEIVLKLRLSSTLRVSLLYALNGGINVSTGLKYFSTYCFPL